MTTISEKMLTSIEHLCSHCGKTFSKRCHLLRHISKQHPDKIAEERLECQLCHAKFKRKDNFTCDKRTCEFRKLGKRENPNQVGGGVPKRQKMDILNSDSQALDHATDKFTINLEQLDQTPETIIDILRDSIMNLKSTIQVELERKRALKIIVALHVVFRQATDPTLKISKH